MRSVILFVLCCGVVLSLAVGVCPARLLTVAIEAEVTSVCHPGGSLEGRVAVGDIIKGTYTYETTAPGSDDRWWRRYEFSSAPCGIVLQAGGLVFRTDPNNVAFTVSVANNRSTISEVRDELSLESRQNLPVLPDTTVDHILIELEEHSLYPSGLLSGALPATAPIVDHWPARTLEIRGYPAYTIVGVLLSAVGPGPVGTLYVDDDARGLGDGSSWLDAYPCLQDALADANTADGPVEIRVAQGLYRPDVGREQIPGDRTATFPLASQVELRGGYAGLTGIDPNARNIQKYETVLSGDLNGDDLPGFRNTADNSYHVVSAIDTDETAILDGFAITSGYADGTINPHISSGLMSLAGGRIRDTG